MVQEFALTAEGMMELPGFDWCCIQLVLVSRPAAFFKVNSYKKMSSVDISNNTGQVDDFVRIWT